MTNRVSSHRLRAIAAIASAVCWLAAPMASAQSYAPRADSYRSLTPAPRPVATAERPGVRLGDFQLHPGLSLAGGYDSNVFYEEQAEGLESAALLRIMPTLRLLTPDPRALRISTNFQVLWERYLDPDDRVSAQGGVEVLGDAGLQIGPRGFLSFTLYDVIRRYVQSEASPSLETRSHLYNEVGGMLAFHPGGADRTSRRGFTSELTVGYGIELWDERLELDRTLIVSRLDAKYFFFPKTAVFVRGDAGVIRYAQTERAVPIPPEDQLGLFPSFEGTLTNVDSTPVRLLGGVSGLLTRAIDFRVAGGWGWGNYDEGSTQSGLLADVRLGMFLNPLAHVGVGYRRDFQDSSFANFYEYDRASGDIKITVEPWVLSIQGGFEWRRFGPVTVPEFSSGGARIPLYNTSERVDPVATGDLSLSWNLSDWVRLSTFYSVRANMTDFVVTTGQPSGPDRPTDASARYIKHEVFLATEFEY